MSDAPSNEPQTPRPAATEPEAAHDEQEAGEKRSEERRRRRVRVAVDCDSGVYAATSPE